MAKPTTTDVVRFETSEGVCLKALFEGLRSFRDCCFEFLPTGIYTYVLSADSTQMCLLSLDTIAPGKYMCRGPISAGLDVTKLFELFKVVTKDDVLTITLTEESLAAAVPHMILVIHSPTRNVTARYEVCFLNIELVRHTIPDKIFDAIVPVPSVQFHHILKMCENGGNKAHLGTKYQDGKPVLILETVADDDNGADDVDTAASNAKITMNVPDNICAYQPCMPTEYYSLKMLTRISHSSSMSPGGDVMIHLSNEKYPLVLEYHVGSLGTIKYCIAPKISDTDHVDNDDNDDNDIAVKPTTLTDHDDHDGMDVPEQDEEQEEADDEIPDYD